MTSAQKKWRQDNKIRWSGINRKSRLKNAAKEKARVSTWRKNNKKRIARYYLSWKMSSPSRRLRCNLGVRISKAIRGLSKSAPNSVLLGCNGRELRLHLESQFKPGMSWDNYGQWHVDHIRPCASFDLSRPEEQRACFHYSNLQPLWGAENIAKGSK